VSRFYIPIEPSHVILAQACLGTLLRLDDHTDKGSVQKIPLFRYAAEYWHQHVLIGNVELQIANALERFFDTDKPHFSAWVRLQGRKNLGIACFLIPDHAPVSVSPLCFAAGKGLRTMVERITIKHPQLVNQFDRTFGSPLHASVFGGGHNEVAQFLLEHGADINSCTAFGTTPLHLASRRGHLKIGKWLLDRGADVNFATYEGRTPLSLASANGHFEFARILLEHNADADSRDDEGSTPLHYALRNENIDVIQLLHDHGVDIRVYYQNGKTSTPLHFAAAGGHLEIARKLLELNAEVNSRNNYGSTPLLLASENGHTGVLRLLLDHNADLNIRDCDGNTPLHRAAFGCQLEVARILLDYNVEVNSRNADGSTPLHRAAERHGKARKDIVQLLLDHKADVHARIPSGQTASEALSEVIRRGDSSLLFRLPGTTNDSESKEIWEEMQNDDPDLRGNTASPTGPEGTSRVPADDPKL
jgi:ankyrin repeat protein